VEQFGTGLASYAGDDAPTSFMRSLNMFSLIGWIIFGAVVGVIARFLMPGRDPMGWIMTIGLGIAGSVLGGLLLGLIIGGRTTDPAGWIGSILGAVLLLWLYRRFAAPKV
jgi:uncharacterized membrane protein YeaQ/YmgE (transglycosylase-associated protein family)